MQIKAIVVGEFAVNCYIVRGTSEQVIVIDPGKDARTIREYIQQNRLEVAAYFLTHGHVDHICGLADLCDGAPAPVYIHAGDYTWAYSPMNQLQPYYDVPRRPTVEHRTFIGSKSFSEADLRIEAIPTPGHTAGSTCFLLPDEHLLFSGDTLFAGSIGRTDLPTADPRRMQHSLDLLRRMPNAIRVYPGHGPETTLAREKRVNPFLAAPGDV
jgi:hydroxyacylglutathione hydrolase